MRPSCSRSRRRSCSPPPRRASPGGSACSTDRTTRKHHLEATPYLGGAALALGLVVAGFVLGSTAQQAVLIAACGLVVFGLGLYDDLRGLGTGPEALDRGGDRRRALGGRGPGRVLRGSGDRPRAHGRVGRRHHQRGEPHRQYGRPRVRHRRDREPRVLRDRRAAGGLPGRRVRGGARRREPGVPAPQLPTGEDLPRRRRARCCSGFLLASLGLLLDLDVSNDVLRIGGTGADPRRSGARHGARHRGAPPGREADHRRREPITPRTGSRPSGSPAGRWRWSRTRRRSSCSAIAVVAVNEPERAVPFAIAATVLGLGVVAAVVSRAKRTSRASP